MILDNITNLGSKEIKFSENEFHSFRVHFNNLFIKEDIETAHNLALNNWNKLDPFDGMHLTDNTDNTDLNRYGMDRIKSIMGILDDILIGFLIDIIENGTWKCRILDSG